MTKFDLILKVLHRTDHPLSAVEICEREPRLSSARTVGLRVCYYNAGEVEIINGKPRRYRLRRENHEPL
jgi:hypothetical protein